MLILVPLKKSPCLKCPERLHNNYEFWEKGLQSISFVLDIVDSGYRLPFKDTTPSKCFLKNNKSALKNSDFVKTAIKQLLSEGKIEEYHFV